MIALCAPVVKRAPFGYNACRKDARNLLKTLMEELPWSIVRSISMQQCCR